MSLPTFQGHAAVWVAGAISEAGNGAFEWGLTRDYVETWRKTWAAENAEMTEAKLVMLAALSLPDGECSADQVTDALDKVPGLWEPPKTRFVVDGYEFDDPESNQAGDGSFPPFQIFDTDLQDYSCRKFDTRDAAQSVADKLNAAWKEANP